MPKISELPSAVGVNAADTLLVVDNSGANAVTKKIAAVTAATSLRNLAKAIQSDTAVVSGSTQIKNIISLTQAQYDSIEVPRADTIYFITD